MHGQYRVNQYEWSKQAVVMLFGVSESTMTIYLCGITYPQDCVMFMASCFSWDMYMLLYDLYPAKSMTWKPLQHSFRCGAFHGVQIPQLPRHFVSFRFSQVWSCHGNPDVFVVDVFCWKTSRFDWPKGVCSVFGQTFRSLSRESNDWFVTKMLS